MTYNERLEICKACPHYSTVGTCGTPVIGNLIEHEGEQVKLCGCFMKIKASIKFLSCPLNKWVGVISEKERVEIKEFLDRIKAARTVTDKDWHQLIKWSTKLKGQKVSRTSCPPCAERIVNELYEVVKM